ncbi:hypothetical protein KI688_007224 [Linnemannia hyalina]|uniref:PiggyBac transposable element-derived protein domain-containing protein n=1 Tax=Linnemannia hyalina TaxID=64524 RepID=A0A9P8BN09_9FUNG|nr:hypothetical protein KI688_007224 [Linnemannia hyalina]
MEPLMSHIQDISKRYYVPQTNVAVDEMIIRFVGISKHTYHIKNKPMPVGDKVLALCGAAGYTFAFLPESRVDKDKELVDQMKLSSMDWNDKHAVVVDDIPNLLWMDYGPRDCVDYNPQFSHP